MLRSLVRAFASSKPAGGVQLVKQLREATSAGILDCKKALDASGGDVDAAVRWLREKGLAKAKAKAARTAAEGLVAVRIDGSRAAVVEMNTETDFLAANEDFQALLAQVAQSLLDTAELTTVVDPQSKSAQVVDLDAFKAASGLDKTIQEFVAKCGENVQLRRAALIETSEAGVIGTYVHQRKQDGMGRIGVLVALEPVAEGGETAAAEAATKVASSVAMHVAADSPLALQRDGVPHDVVDAEMQVAVSQAAQTGKNERVQASIVTGKMNKWYQDVALLDQIYGLSDDDISVGKLVARDAPGFAISSYARFMTGEGIQPRSADFAAEVEAAKAAAAGGQ